MAVFDELAETDGDEKFKAWLSQVIDAKRDIVTFVASRQPGNPAAEFDGYLKGSFNLSLIVKFSDGQSRAVIRFPKPGHTAVDVRGEKVRNEVHFLEFLLEKTTIPVPKVFSWGTTEESPNELGPFIIMEFVEGVSLATLLKEPTKTEQDEVILATEVDDAKLDSVYEQLADYMLQLSQLQFSMIGTTVTDRPLTYNMNELQTVVSNYPTRNFPTTPFASGNEFLASLAAEHLVHLRTQHSLAESKEDAQKRFIARHQFKNLVPRYCTDENGPFRPFCDDLQPTNMLANPDTFRITAILDWEFANIMPAQFAHDPTWWLLLLGPDMWLEHHYMDEFKVCYMPRMEQFLRALRRVEGRKDSPKCEGGPRLSERMQDSWDTGRFWFDCGIRKSFDVDAVYWAALHREEFDEVGDETEMEMKTFVKMKMEQLKAYDADCKARFSS
ncbi:phosphotransferase enzyme family protein-like protein [Lentithecium fluviatile CBS 122367]|uniref:Phosphotransferase enzyme family protein-like protein n=1 Tax=Lentithecium fluviatile CBS 122367 TaxID=1168545 RepID=A0A6G1J545_9PLEO|nr:phosphotransferase enzyme family protein-like protein [Lentithecium fluviatile CBS 122367]